MSTPVLKLCKHCRFHRRGLFKPAIFAKCHHPLSLRWRDVQLVDGSAPTRMDCDEMRGKYDKPCGPEAKLWELK